MSLALLNKVMNEPLNLVLSTCLFHDNPILLNGKCIVILKLAAAKRFLNTQ
jgi:hypothetical protein